MKKPPVWLPPTTDAPIQVQLIIGSFKYEPFEHTLFDLQLPRSQLPPQHPDERMYGVQPEIAHTFRPEQKIPPKFMSLVFALATLSPWAVLLRLVRLYTWRFYFILFFGLNPPDIYISSNSGPPFPTPCRPSSKTRILRRLSSY